MNKNTLLNCDKDVKFTKFVAESSFKRNPVDSLDHFLKQLLKLQQLFVQVLGVLKSINYAKTKCAGILILSDALILGFLCSVCKL